VSEQQPLGADSVEALPVTKRLLLTLEVFLKRRKTDEYLNGTYIKGDMFAKVLNELARLTNGEADPQGVIERLFSFCISETMQLKWQLNTAKDANVHQRAYWGRKAGQEVITWLRTRLQDGR